MDHTPTKPTIFVLMPFKRELDNTFYAIEQAASAIGAHAERADRPVTTEMITQRIYGAIESTNLVVADLTDKNSNVFYEVGYAHALGKPVALLAPTIEQVPFDLRVYPVLTYTAGSPVAELVDRIKPHLQAALRTANDTAPLRGPLERALKDLTRLKPGPRLFRALLASRIATFQADVSQWVAGTMAVGPEETREKGIEILNNLTIGGFATFLVPVEWYWVTGTEYLEAARRAAKERSARITRVFILFDESGVESPSLRECIAKDQHAGIETLICFADKITDREAIRDFGIWDQEVLCSVEVTTVRGISAVTGCVFTTDVDKLARASRWRENILATAEPATRVLARFTREEQLHQPLVASAGIMVRIADESCRGSYLDKQSCRWYHRSWQFLRLVDAVSTPDWHADFYRTRISRAATSLSPKRVLVCGTADYCMLAHLIGALPNGLAAECEIVVVDLCNTPLKLCDWFAARIGVRIRTSQSDALQLDLRDNWFGLVLTDAFLSRFTSRDRGRVVSEWARVLAPGGVVVTTVRVDGDSPRFVASSRDAQAFVAKVRGAAYKQAHVLPCTPDEVEQMAQAYAEKITSFPLSEVELRALFAAFETEIEFGNTPGEFKPTRYARVAARRP